MDDEQKKALARVIESHDDELDHHGAPHTSSEDIDVLRPLVEEEGVKHNVFDSKE